MQNLPSSRQWDEVPASSSHNTQGFGGENRLSLNLCLRRVLSPYVAGTEYSGEHVEYGGDHSKSE